MYRRILSFILACLMLLPLLSAAADNTGVGCNHDYMDYYQKPTCTSPGVYITKCKKCGETWKDPAGEALGHSFSWTVVEPTCTEQGTRTGVCDRCGHTWVGYDDALGHNWGEWQLIKEATPNEYGYRERECKRCHITEREYFKADGSKVTDPVIVTKQLYESEAVSTPDAPVYFTVDVENNSDNIIEMLELRDCFVDYDTSIIIDGSICTIKPHTSINYIFSITATEIDPEFTYGEITDYMTVEWRYADGSYDGITSSNEVTVLIAEGDAPSDVLMTKYLFDDPAGEYFVEGENARIGIDIENNTPDDIVICMVQDIDVESDSVISSVTPDMIINAGSDGTVVIDYVITSKDVECGFVTDYAIVEWYPVSAERSDSNYYFTNTLTLACSPSYEEFMVEKYLVDEDESGAAFGVGAHLNIGVDFVNLTDRNMVIDSIDDIIITKDGYVVTVGGSETVLPEERVSCFFMYDITGEDVDLGYVTDYAVVNWHYEDDPDIERCAITNELTIVCGVNPPITIEKTNIDPEGTVYKAGDTANFMVDIINSSDETIHDVYFFDYIIDTDTYLYLDTSYTDVEPGNSSFLFNYIVQPEDAARGYVFDVVVAMIGAGDITQVMYSNEVVINCEGAPVDLSLIKDLKYTPERGYFTENEYINYSFEFTNNSDVDLIDVTLYDEYIGASVNLGNLPANTVTVADLDYLVTYADCETGNVYNVASVTAHDIDGNYYQVTSNAMSVPCGFVPEPDPVNVSIAVKKQVISQPMFGERYVPGEPVIYLVTVTNTGDVPVYDLNAFDDIYTYYGPVELYDFRSAPLQPGENYSFTFETQMEYIDCECGEVWDYAYVIYNADNDMGGIEYSDSCVVYGEVGTPDNWPENAMLMKYEISTPKNGYYVEGETVSFMVVFYNNTNETLSDLTIYDILSDAPGGIIWNQFSVDPYEVIMVQVDYKVTAIDADIFGEVTNIAWATASTRASEQLNYTSNEVTVPCGKPGITVPSHGNSCVKTLVASNNGAELVRTDLCKTHHTLELKTQNMDAASAAAMWERNVYTMYASLINITGSSEFITDRDMFLSEINILKELLGEDNIQVITELLRERATELCYELSGLTRKDDILKPVTQNPLPVLTVNNCVYDVRTSGSAWYQTTSYTAAGHLMTQNAVDKLLAAAIDDFAYTETLLDKANSLWMTALNGEYGILARENPAYTADLALFVNGINTRKAALNAIYPDDPDLVSGLIIREIRNRTIILCENAK